METTDQPRVRKVDDMRIEVPRRYSETGSATDPVALRPGTDDGWVKIDSGLMEVKISDLREGLDLIETEAAT